MRTFYYKDPNGNFGDDLNEWLWDRLLPETFDTSTSSWVSLIGSLIHNAMPTDGKKTVFSSGAGCGPAPQNFPDKEWDIICVRGPLTASAFNLPASAAVTDGSILLALLEECQPHPESERKNVVFMPHHFSHNYAEWEDVCQKAGITLINPHEDSQRTIQKLRKAKLVLADAMHAAIVADTLRVPWVPLQSTPHTNGFKWMDWCLSMNLEYKPIKTPSSNLHESWTRFVYNAMGGFYTGGRTHKKALNAYKKKFLKRHTYFWEYERKLRAHCAFTLRKIAALYLKTPIGRKANERQKQKAALSLIKAAKSQSYLSQNQVFQAQLKEMSKRLDLLKNKASIGEKYD